MPALIAHATSIKEKRACRSPEMSVRHDRIMGMTRSRKPFDEAAFAASRGPELIAQLQAKEHQARLLHAEILDIVSDLERDGIPKLAGHRPAGLISEALHMSPKQASTL